MALAGGNVQDANAHGKQGSELLILADLGMPDDLPRQHREGYVSGARIYRADRVVGAQLGEAEPAVARDPDADVPQRLDGPAPDPLEQGDEAQHEIDRDEHEPDDAPGPAFRDAQQRDGEGRLGPGGRQDGEEAGEVREEEQRRQVVGRDEAAVLAQAEVHAGRHESR